MFQAVYVYNSPVLLSQGTRFLGTAVKTEHIPHSLRTPVRHLSHMLRRVNAARRLWAKEGLHGLVAAPGDSGRGDVEQHARAQACPQRAPPLPQRNVLHGVELQRQGIWGCQAPAKSHHTLVTCQHAMQAPPPHIHLLPCTIHQRETCMRTCAAPDEGNFCMREAMQMACTDTAGH